MINYQYCTFFQWKKSFKRPQNRIIPSVYLHSSECRLSQFGVFGLQSHLQGQQTALPAGGPAHKQAQLKRQSWSNTGPGLCQGWANLSSSWQHQWDASTSVSMAELTLLRFESGEMQPDWRSPSFKTRRQLQMLHRL